MTYRERKMTVAARVADLLGLMSATEKIGQLNQFLCGWKCFRRGTDTIDLTEEFKNAVRHGGQGAVYGLFRADPWSGMSHATGLLPQDGPRVANMVQRFAIENSRWGIPLLLSEECPHGHMALDGTLFPTNLGAACSWNPALYEKAMQGVACEIRSRGGNLGLITVLDLVKDPRWGRTEETLGEDPCLSAKFAEAAVRGLQGPDAEYFGEKSIGAVVKHAVAQGEAIGGHNAAPAIIGERELREIYLPALQGSFRAGAASIMAAYNEIDGLACIGNRRLLTNMFRNELGFRGMIMADGTAIDRLLESMGVTLPEAAAVALRAGVDLSLWDKAYLHLGEALDRGLIRMEDLDAATGRVLTLKFRLGLFDQPYIDEGCCVTTRSEALRETNLQLARESLVLLKNEKNFLPLSRSLKRIAVLGPNADHIYNQLGDYTSSQREDHVITLLQGIRAAVSKETEVVYRQGCGIKKMDDTGLAETAKAAAESDVAILCLGGASTRPFDAVFAPNGAMVPGKIEAETDCGEGFDAASLSLPGLQEELFLRVIATGTPTIVVLVQGRPYAIPEIAEKAQGVLAAWYPGQEGGRAVAEALFGEINPSGKLCLSVPRSEGQLPVYYNHKPLARGDYQDLLGTPLYPFGHGLSYTRFGYRDLIVEPLHDAKSTRFKATVTVENQGDRPGAEVVQLYLRDKAASITRRVAELKGFSKVTLESRESRQVSFELGEDELGLWNSEMRWVVEPGEFEVRMGGDSTATLSASFTVKQGQPA